MFFPLVDDFRLTACVSLLRRVKSYNEEKTPSPSEADTVSCHDNESETAESSDNPCANPDCTKSRPSSTLGNTCHSTTPSCKSALGTAKSKLPATRRHFNHFFFVADLIFF